MKKQNLLFILLSALTSLMHAQATDTTQVPGGGSLYVEEDSFNSNWNKDRNYTGGFALTFTGPNNNSNWLVVPFFRKNLDRLLHIEKLFSKVQGYKPYLICNSFAVGTSVFTPFVLDDPAIIHGDRPYASLVFASSRSTRIWEDYDACEDKVALSTELNIGALGLSAGKVMQTEIHRFKINQSPSDTSNRPLPLGWANQISNGGEITAMYRVDIQNRFGTIYWSKKNWNKRSSRSDHHYKLMELSGETGLNIGYYTNVSAGLALKVGFFNCAFWQNRTNFGSSIQQFTSNEKKRLHDSYALASLNNKVIYFGDTTQVQTLTWKEKLYRNFELYGVAGVRSRLVGYNALLQGQFKPTAYTLEKDEITRIVNEFEFGVAIRVGWVNFIWEPYAGRSTELNTLYARTHIWGAFHFSINMPIE